MYPQLTAQLGLEFLWLICLPACLLAVPALFSSPQDSFKYLATFLILLKLQCKNMQLVVVSSPSLVWLFNRLFQEI